MARPTKQGIDYFPLDCQFDDKIEMYLIETGAVGLGFLVTIWQMIYTNEGYYITDNEDLRLLVKRKIDLPVLDIDVCVEACLKREIFNSYLWDRYKILTSKAIQKRYFDAAKKKKHTNFVKQFLLIEDNLIENGVKVDINAIKVSGNATKVNVKEEVKEKGEVKLNEKTLVELKPDDAKEIFEYWQKVMNHPRAAFDNKRKTLIKKWFKHYSADDLKKAIDGCSITPHNMGENKEGRVYDSIELILRDAKHIDDYMRNADKPPASGVTTIQQTQDRAQQQAERIKKQLGWNQ